MADQLPSWTDGPAKAQILEFVRSVTEPGASFVLAADRIAAFDNDGTLWCEKPTRGVTETYAGITVEVRRDGDSVQPGAPVSADGAPQTLLGTEIAWRRGGRRS